MQPSVLVRWVIWFALFSSIGMYFVVLQMNGENADSADDPQSNLTKVFLIVGLILMVASLGVKHLAAHAVNRAGQRKFPTWGFPAFIIALALGEAPAILGLVLGFGGATVRDYLPLFVISLVTLGLLAPPFFFRGGEDPNSR